MRDSLVFALALTVQHYQRRLAAALDLAALPFAFAAHLACDVADAVGRAMTERASVRGVSGCACDDGHTEPEHMAIPGAALTICGRDLHGTVEPDEVGTSYPCDPCERVEYTTRRERVTCWHCLTGIAWAAAERARRVADDAPPTPVTHGAKGGAA
jgi:hypothetical protein